MENEVKQRNQRNRRRERAQRMQAQRERQVKDGDSGEDESPAREKPPRPSARRKKSREPLGEEDIIDGFAIMAFRTYEDLEAAVKCATSPRAPSLASKPRLPLATLPSDPARHPPNNVNNSHAITLLLDAAGTSDDSGRASERLTGSSVAPRDPDSSRDRLSDASSRCSSGKGYICDSEGDDDKASADNSRNGSPRYHDTSMDDGSDGSVMFRMSGANTGFSKSELVARGGSGGAVALSRAPVGGTASPAPAPLPQPAPSPAPAALPPPAPPPPALRAATPLRPLPAVEGHAGTQTPARPVGAAAQRATADSPTPAPPAPSPLYAALPDHRLTNHEARTKPAEPRAEPTTLHHIAARAPAAAAHPSLASHAPHPVMPGHDVRNVQPPTHVHQAPVPSFPNHVASITNHINGLSNGAPTPAPQTTLPTPLPSLPLPVRSISPSTQPRSYPPPQIGSSHINSNISTSIHNHSPYQIPNSIQKHSIPFSGRPAHLAPFSISSHLSNHVPSSTNSQLSTPNQIHPISSQPSINHSMHLPLMNSTSLSNQTNLNHIGPPPTSLPSAIPNLPNFSHSHKHPGLSLPPHPNSLAGSLPSSTHSSSNHMDTSPVNSVPPTPLAVSSASSHSLVPPAVDTRQAASDVPSRTESLAVSCNVTTNGYPPPAVYSGANYPPLYAPYATSLQHTPYLPPAAASPRNSTDMRMGLSASPLVAPKTPKGVRPHTPGSTGAAGAVPPHLVYSPRGHSPTRERDSYSSNISSLSRASVSTPISSAPASVSSAVTVGAPSVPTMAASVPVPLVAPLAAPLPAPTPTPAAPPSTHLAHSLAPVPTVGSISSGAKPPAHWGVTSTAPERPAGYPAAPLFGAPLPPPNPNPFSAESLFQTSPGADLLRRELDNRFLAAAGGAFSVRTEMHHHQHQHTHVHQHPPHHHPHHQLLVPHHHSLFKDVGKMSLYRGGLGLGYPYSSGLLPGAPYVPPAPAPLPTFAPKPVVSVSSEPAPKPPRPAVVKTGKWNAMHVRIAWEIYNHQQKEKAAGGVPDKDKLRGFPAPAPPYRTPYELPPAAYLPPHHPHLGERTLPQPPYNYSVSPFARYGASAYPGAAPPFGLSAYARELALSAPLHPPPGVLHDWRTGVVPRAPPPAPHLAPPNALHHEERARREREERRDKEERERRKQREREAERVRQRSPLRNGMPEPHKEERKEAPRPPPTYAPAWDPYRYDPLQHMRFPPLVEAAIRAEEEHRAKMLSAYAAHHPQLKALHRPHAPLPPLPAPLDLLKKEEPR